MNDDEAEGGADDDHEGRKCEKTARVPTLDDLATEDHDEGDGDADDDSHHSPPGG